MKTLTESSMSRLIKHSNEHDCGTITSFRKTDNCDTGKPYTEKENKQRNKSLVNKLLAKGYSVTSVRGRYPESGVVVEEDSYFVVDIKDTGNLEEDLYHLGVYFDQDSVLIVPKGSLGDKREDLKIKPYLLGTNECEAGLGLGIKLYFDKKKIGTEGKYYTTYINDKPYYLDMVMNESVCKPSTGYGHWVNHIFANMDWKDIP